MTPLNKNNLTMQAGETIKTVFFGTHDFAATILEGLINNPLFSVDLVITQPDKPVGRSAKLESSPVKKLAEKNSIKIQQPNSLVAYNLELTTYDLGITAQYGLIIPEKIFNAPKYGILNVHTSLLPKYRGASPIQSALVNGETETGITIIKMDKGLDTGLILLQKSIKIQEDDTYPDLDRKLAKIGLECLLGAIPDYISGNLSPTPQNNALATTCKQLTREDGKIDWNKSAQEIYNQYRGLTPWPGIWTGWDDKRLKLIKIKLAKHKIETGTVLVENDKIYIGCGNGSIEVLELQLEGKKTLATKEFLNGFSHINNQLLL
jgi:methionyl-tRNA formyltransferase